MAILSTHTLNSVDGSHAGHVALQLVRIQPDGKREVIIDAATDEGGRFSQELTLNTDDTQAGYELVLQTGAYFAERQLADKDGQILREVVMRFDMPDAQGRYHIPFMLAPHSYSVWWSSL